jgi:spore maturation protein SpmA
MVVGSRPPRPADVFLALLLTTLVSTSVGWLTSSIVPRELEGTLVLIGLVGLQISIPVSGTADLFIPYYGPLRITDYSRNPTGLVGLTIHAVLWSIVIACAALALWKRRVRIHPPSPAADFYPVTARTTGDAAPAQDSGAQSRPFLRRFLA